jgi:hypothetical protein
MQRIRKAAPVERPVRQGAGLGATADWPRLVQGIRENSMSAVLEFKEKYRRGVTVFLRRQVGAVGLELLVEEVLDGAVSEIAGGRVVAAGDLVHFLRNVLERELLIRNLDPARSLVALATATDHARLTREAGFIKQALVTFTEPEQRALRSYYDGELTAEQAAATAGIPADAFARLRERLYEAVRMAGLRKAPRAEMAPVRAMAASSGGVA